MKLHYESSSDVVLLLFVGCDSPDHLPILFFLFRNCLRVLVISVWYYVTENTNIK